MVRIDNNDAHALFLGIQDVTPLEDCALRQIPRKDDERLGVEFLNLGAHA